MNTEDYKKALRGARSALKCCYCGEVGHVGNNCAVTFTPITDCEHKDPQDGCCSHPKNMTPECHPGACPRLHQRIYQAWAESLPNAELSHVRASP